MTDIAMRCEGAHPRSRGEHWATTSQKSISSGSSPLTRGALRPVTDEPEKERLIPAHAGST